MNVKKMILQTILKTQVLVIAVLTFPMSFLVIIISKPIYVNVTYYFILEVLKLYLLMKRKYNLALQKLYLVLPLTQS